MNINLIPTLAIVWLMQGLMVPGALAAGGHGHGSEEAHEDHEEAAKGPHGGRLLEAGEFALEMTIFEQGVPAQFRVYPFNNHEPLDPSEVSLSVELHRLGGAVDHFAFEPEGEYLVGDNVVNEPHSFDVHVQAHYDGERYEWTYESHEGRTLISERFAQEAGVITEAAAPRALRVTERLYGVIQPNQERLARIRAPYPGEIVELNASIGDQVNKGEVLARVKSRESLETYAIHAPISGVVTERHLNVGELAESVPLLELVDLSEVWLELLAYPEQKPRLKQGQRVDIRDMTGAQTGEARIDYIAPQRRRQDQGTLVRATLNNEKGIWSPGMMVTGDVVVEEREVPLAVKRSALQTFRDFTVVFARFGDTYEVRMLDLGEGDQDYVEVRDGLEPGTEYVIENSYLIKADVLKSGASHDH